MYMINKRAFTLVELIIVITILSILWTIAFTSMSKYMLSTRDSVRVSDIGKLNTAVNLFYFNAWKFPEPTNWIPITYWWTEVWNQWIFWVSTVSNVKTIAHAPSDPLTDMGYTYSVNALRNEFQFAWILEWDTFALLNPLLLWTVNASNNWNNWNNWSSWNSWNNWSIINSNSRIAKVYVTWNYNWKISKIIKGDKIIILALPSLLSSFSWTLEDILDINGLVYAWYSNLPFNYISSQYKVNWEDDFNLINKAHIEIFYGWVSDLNDEGNQISFIKKLQKAYNWTEISNLSDIDNLLNYDTVNDISWTKFFAQNLIHLYIDKSIKIYNK